MNSVKNIRFFLLWAVLCIAANLFFTVSLPYEGDQGCWADWIRQLMDGGFGAFRGNYPPVYVLWLWVVGKIYVLTGLVVERSSLLKFLCLVPVYFAHLGLLQIVWTWLAPRKIGALEKHLILGFSAFNPALIAVGPIWGQVDLIPLFFAVGSLSLLLSPKRAVWSVPLFVLAILTKFQMIAFLPVFGGLWIRRAGIAWKGVFLSIPLLFAVLFPFFLTGSLKTLFLNAYVTSASMYPYSSYNAANLWMFLQGNVQLDTIPLFGFSGRGIGRFITPNYVGKLLFILFSIGAFIKSLRIRNPRYAFKWAAWTGFAFFVLLPEMHERYIVCAIPPSLLWLSRSKPKSCPWILLLSLFAAGNITMLNGFRGDDLWTPFSLIICVTFFAACLLWAFPKLSNAIMLLLKRIPAWKILPYFLLVFSVSVILMFKVSALRPVFAELDSDSVLLYDLPLVSQQQGFKNPNIGRSVDNNALTAGGQIYGNGIGSHAPSKLVYRLPADADSLRFGYGVDDEAKPGEVIFSIRLDDNVVWTSGVVHGGVAPSFAKIPLHGAKVISLETDTHGPDSYDHADWLLPVVTRSK
ncbi:MAG: NPCBM/NEW2 domain-containing protein [Fibrobacteraceae bacterium]|nr:NPCBM/NEW2 domain-containing protein [Fibrobacteraceae bacterium]